MTVLARRVMLSSGGLTRLMGRLEDRGLVHREPDPADAPAFHASLTDAGSEQLAQARITHDSVIEELLGSKLSQHQAAELTPVLRSVLDGS